MTSSDDGGYVHDPSTFDDDDERRGDAGESDDWGPAHPATVDREFDWRGWILVGMIVVAFVVAPVAIVLRPPGLDYRVALLILPLLPAVLLALTAVWATTRP